MTAINDWPAVNKAVRMFLRHADGTLSENTFERLEGLADQPGSAVVSLIGTIELLYARREEVGVAGNDILRQLAEFAVEWDFFGMRTSGRGMGIMRVAGGDEADAPVPMAEYANPALVELSPGSTA